MNKASNSMLKISFIFLLTLNTYVILFVLTAKPCENMNRAISEDEGTMIIEGTLLYPNGTFLCFSNNSRFLNSFGYYVFWPLHRFLYWRGFAYFSHCPHRDNETGPDTLSSQKKD